MERIVCASANPKKVAEIEELLAGVVELIARPPDVPDVVEDADTLVGNARLKAAALVRATGLPAVADDTGLFVEALDGRPGVFTARYAGDDCTDQDNRTKMLAELRGRPDRDAQFRTVVIVVWPDGDEVVVEGACAGRIAESERGDRGFGYDPIFEPMESGGLTFAEMDPAAKHAISHRGRAFRALFSELERR